MKGIGASEEEFVEQENVLEDVQADDAQAPAGPRMVPGPSGLIAQQQNTDVKADYSSDDVAAAAPSPDIQVVKPTITISPKLPKTKKAVIGGDASYIEEEEDVRGVILYVL